jgi:hypothetical protein
MTDMPDNEIRLTLEVSPTQRVMVSIDREMAEVGDFWGYVLNELRSFIPEEFNLPG